MIRYDVSDPTVLVQCSECPSLAVLRWTRRDAYLAGANHEIDTHGRTPSQALSALRLWEQRQARRKPRHADD